MDASCWSDASMAEPYRPRRSRRFFDGASDGAPGVDALIRVDTSPSSARGASQKVSNSSMVTARPHPSSACPLQAALHFRVRAEFALTGRTTVSSTSGLLPAGRTRRKGLFLSNAGCRPGGVLPFRLRLNGRRGGNGVRGYTECLAATRTFTRENPPPCPRRAGTRSSSWVRAPPA